MPLSLPLWLSRYRCLHLRVHRLEYLPIMVTLLNAVGRRIWYSPLVVQLAVCFRDEIPSMDLDEEIA